MTRKIALITGGSRGIGAATAKALASRGYIVLINYLSNKSAAEFVAGEIEMAGGKAYLYQADTRSESDIERMMNDIQRHHGQVDIVVANANMNFVLKPLMAMSWDEFSQKLNDEMKAAFHITKAVLPSMIKNQFGRIVLVSSVLSEMPMQYFIAHGTAKGALDSFARYIAHECGDKGITCNVVSPSLIETDATLFVPVEVKEFWKNSSSVKRLGRAEDVAATISFLVGEECGFITGANVPVTGGIR